MNFNFKNPTDNCRGTDFWMLNDTLNADELRRQLRCMHEQGIASVIVRTYIGLKSDYPGADFMDKMRIVVSEAKRLGMTLFMQAMYMPEAVLGLPNEHILGNIHRVKSGDGAGELLCSKDGFDYILSPSNNILDMLSKSACEYYVNLCYDKMWSSFKAEYGKTIISVWVDEPSFMKTELPFTKDLPKAFYELWGYELPLDKIYLMFEDGEGCETLRYHYQRTVLKLITESYFATVRDWCNKNGLMFSGHLMAEDSMENQIKATCFTMPCYKYFDIPGIDNLETALNWSVGEIKPKKELDRYWRDYGHYNTPLQCSSVAHQMGKKQVLCEMYGVSTENLSFRDQLCIFDRFAVLGVNHRSVHGLFYSLRGRSKRAYPPHINCYQPYFEQYKVLTDTIARKSAFLRDGKPVRDILLIHPMDSAFCIYKAACENSVARYDSQFNETLRLLVATQQNFELGDEDTISLHGIADEFGFKIGEMSYKTVVLPNMVNIRSTTLVLLKRYIKLGGRVVILGKAPTMLDGENCDLSNELRGANIVNSHNELCKLLADSECTYTFAPDDDGTGVSIYYAAAGDSANYFIVNTDCSTHHSGVLTVNGSCSAMMLIPESGESAEYPTEPNGDTTDIRVELPAGSSIMLCVSLDSKAQQCRVPRKTVSQFSLEHKWQINRLDKNALLLEMFRFAREGEPLSAKSYPILAIHEILSAENYCGNISLECEFKSDVDVLNAQLVLESPSSHKIKLDGIEISNCADGFYHDRSFETVSLPLISTGSHVISFERHFEPVGKAKMAVTSLFENLGGIELEQMLIIGDFAVSTQAEPTIDHVIRLNPDMRIAAEKPICSDELTHDGYPFYAGRMELTAEFELSADECCRDVYLSLHALYAATAEVYLNGVLQGNVSFEPLRIRLNNARLGANSVTIRLYGTLRNTLGPWHRPVGEIGAAWGGYSFPNLPWLGADNFDGTVDMNWYEDRTPDKKGWTESYLLLPFGVKDAKIELE